MQGPGLITRALIAGLVLNHYTSAGPTLLLRDKEHDPLERHLDMGGGGWAHGACAPTNDFSTPESRANIWFHGHGNDLVEYFLRNVGEDKHSNVDWAQTMLQLVLKGQNTAQMSCNGSADACTIGSLSCDQDFKEWPAVFYTFVSLQNIHTFFAQYLERLTWMKTNLSGDMETLVHDFQADKDSDEKLNVWAIVAAALGMSAGLTAPNGFVSGTFGYLSGIASMIANTKPGEAGLEELGQLRSNLATIINNICETAYKGITEIQDAIFWHEGGDEKKIPEEMLRRTDFSKDYQHPTALVFGEGQWLLDHPVEDLRQNFDEVGRQVKQTLALQLLRLFHKAYLIITPDKAGCDGKDQAWDDEAGQCYSLIAVSHDSPIGPLEQWNINGLGDISDPLWNKYGADKLWTFRNIVDCWTVNKGKIGTPTLSTTSPGSGIKQCFFSIEVKKGAFGSAGGAFPSYLNLVSDDDFPNFSSEDKINHGGRPSTCRQEPCSEWPLNHNL